MARRARSWGHRRRWLIATCACLMLVLGAATWYWYSGRSSVQTTDHGLKVMVAGRSRVGFKAAVFGKVSRIGQCVGLNDNLTIWPHGTRVDDDAIVVAGRRYEIGDSFEGGGGIFEQNSDDFDPADISAPSGCPVTDGIVLLTP